MFLLETLCLMCYVLFFLRDMLLCVILLFKNKGFLIIGKIFVLVDDVVNEMWDF